jgi:hypothetical protein
VRVLVDECERVRVAAAVSRDRCLENDRARGDLDHRERMRIAMRIDTDDVVQLICKHPFPDLQPERWGTQTGVGLGWEPRAAEL